MKKYLVAYSHACKSNSGFGNVYMQLNHDNLPSRKEITELEQHVSDLQPGENVKVIVLSFTEVSLED